MPTVIYHYTYLITNTTNQMQYIGVRSCSCLPENDSDYMGSSEPLDEAMVVEPEAFTKTILDTFPTRDIANDAEQQLHEIYDVARNPLFYNLCIAPMGFCNSGRTLSDATKKKMSVAHSGDKHHMYGKKHSIESRKKMSEAAMGRNPSEETRKKNSIAKSGEKHPMYGKKHSAETLKKMSEAKMGKTHSPEARKKMSEAGMGKIISPETRKKLSEAHSGEKSQMYGKKHSAETKKKMSEAHLGKKLTDEHKKKLSAAKSGENHPMYGKHLPEETRKKMSETHKNRKKLIPNELYNI